MQEGPRKVKHSFRLQSMGSVLKDLFLIYPSGTDLPPDGKDIKLAKGLTQGQKLQIVGELQKLTNDKIVYKTLKDGTTQIKIASLGEGSKTTGTSLLRELNSSKRAVTIDYKNSQGWFSNGNGNKAGTFDATNASNGKGANAVINFDPDSVVY